MAIRNIIRKVNNMINKMLCKLKARSAFMASLVFPEEKVSTTLITENF